MLVRKIQFLKSRVVCLLLIGIIIYASIFSVLSITRHEHFSSHGWDLALYEQMIWKYSSGQIAFSSLTHQLDLGDRFRPTMLLVVPFYKLWPDTKLLLIIQALLIASSALPLFLLALRKTESYILSLTIAFASILFVGSQSLMMNDFHELAFLPVFLASAFLFLDKKQWKLYFLMLVLALGVREYIGFIIASLGISLFFMKVPGKVAVFTFILGLVWSFIAIFIIMPRLGGNAYTGFLGKGEPFGKEVAYIISNPGFLIYNAFQPNLKLQTVFVSFASFGFLSFLYPPLLFPIATHFLIRFLDLTHRYRWTYYFQYSADLAVLLSVAVIYSTANFNKLLNKFKLKAKYSLEIMILCMAVLIIQILVPTPLKLLLHKDFFQAQSYMQYNNEMFKLIPPDVSVAAQNTLAAHLGRRNQLSILPDVGDAEYIAVDLHPGQDNFDLYGLSYNDMRNLLGKYQNDNLYKIIYQKGDSFLLKKNI